MSDYIEFRGRTLDEAIKEACTFYGAEREKLEIDIISNAKSGIFGLVGAKKATVRARRAQVPGMAAKDFAKIGEKPGQTLNGHAKEQPKPEAAPKKEPRPQTEHTRPQAEHTPPRNSAAPKEQPVQNAGQPRSPQAVNQERPEGKNGRNAPQVFEKGASAPRAVEKGGSAPQSADKKAPAARPRGQSAKGAPPKSEPNGQAGRQGQPKRTHAPARPENDFNNEHDFSVADVTQDAALNEEHTRLPLLPLEGLDQERLQTVVLDSVKNIAGPIVGTEASYAMELGKDRIFVLIDKVENPGLLIGRDGQTLSALQYLVSGIVSRHMQTSVRVQVDAGDYRERQNEKLRELALGLAQKVKESGKPQSTRPLSAYQRRTIHVALQEDTEVQTHSKGEGGLKRVVVLPRRRNNNHS